MANTKNKKVGVAWAKTSQDGTKQYTSIVINGGLSPDIELVMFPNSYKQGENSPDFILYMNPPREAPGQGQAAPKTAQPAAGGAEFPDDDIPY